MKLQSAGANAKRVIGDNGNFVGLALELANGRWAPFNKDDRRLVDTSISFKNPNEVLKFFKMAGDGLKGGLL